MDYFSSAISGNPRFLGQHCFTVGFDCNVFHTSTMDEEMFFGSTATPKQFMKVSVAFAKIYSALENISLVIKQEGDNWEKTAFASALGYSQPPLDRSHGDRASFSTIHRNN